MNRTYLFLIVCIFFSCTSDPSSENIDLIEIKSGEIDRYNSIVSISAPSNLKNQEYYLVDPEGQIIRTQISDDDITFLLPYLESGKNINLELVPSNGIENKKMGIRFLNDAIEFTDITNEPILQYRTGPGGLDLENVDEIYYRGGYLHPLFSPNGHVLTQQYTQQRQHQNGIWTGWYRTEWNGLNPNFWIQDEGTGEVQFYSIDKVSSGSIYAELQTTHHFVEKITEDFTPVLSDQWRVRAYSFPVFEEQDAHVIDLEVKQSNITENTFTLVQYIYGGVGFRGNDQWLGSNNMQLITSEGENREDAHMSRARWALLSGMLDGEMTNIAILAHPDNTRSPEPIFVNQEEPFFIFSPLQLDDLTIEPSQTFNAKYRYIIMDGEIPKKEVVEKLWMDYAHPVEGSIHMN